MSRLILVVAGSAALVVAGWTAAGPTSSAAQRKQGTLRVLKQATFEQAIAGVVFEGPTATPVIYQSTIPSLPPGPGTKILPVHDHLLRSEDWRAARIVTYTRDTTRLSTLERQLQLDLEGEHRFAISNDGSSIVAFGEGRVRLYGSGGALLRELDVENVREVRVSGDGRLTAISTRDRLLLVDRSRLGDEPDSAPAVDDLRISETGLWQAHVRDRTISLLRGGALVAAFSTEGGLLRHASFSSNERHLGFVDQRFAYLIDLSSPEPTLLHRVEADAGSEYRSTSFGEDDLWALGSIRIERPPRRATRPIIGDRSPVPGPPVPFREGRARIAVQTIELDSGSFALTNAWWKWLYFWNKKSPAIKLRPKKLYVETWLEVLEGDYT